MDVTYLGVLDEKIANYWHINEHKNKPILVYEDRIKHVIEKHLHDFGNVDKIMESFESLSDIIKKPDYVFYDNKKKGLEYYKYIDKDICVVVRISSGKVLKVRSWYPVTKTKINNRKKKEKELA